MQRVASQIQLQCKCTSGRTLSTGLQKKYGVVRKSLSESSESCLENGETNTSKVSDRHFPPSFLTIWIIPIVFKLDARPIKTIIPLHETNCNNVDWIKETDVEITPCLRAQTSHFFLKISLLSWLETTHLIWEYTPYISADLTPFISGRPFVFVK